MPANLLAALPSPEWREVNRHVRTYRACQSDVVDLAPLLGLLNRLRFDDWRILESPGTAWPPTTGSVN